MEADRLVQVRHCHSLASSSSPPVVRGGMFAVDGP